MMRSHDRIEELVAIRAIGGLDGPDEADLESEMASHGPDCGECRRLETEYAEVAGRLAFALDPVEVGPGFERGTMALAFGEAPSPRGSVGGRLRPLVAVAAALVVFAGGLLAGSTIFGGAAVPSRSSVVAFRTEEPGTITAAYTPGERGIYLIGSDLPALPRNRVYELWLIEGETPAPATCVSPSPDGSLFAFVDADVGTSDVMAVTIEPSRCSQTPSTTPIYVAELASA
jgi:anti-sigma-K factor RskA